MSKLKGVVIIGGGITGLSAAFYAQKMAKEKEMDIQITLIEQENTLGGKIQTLRRDGFTIERGPDSFLSRKLPMIHLAEELGLTDQLVGMNPQAKKTFILHKGKFHRIPPGLTLGIPTDWKPFLQTGLISPIGKARAALDLVLPRKETKDESLGDFLQRRLGAEVVGHITEPLLSGIYAGDSRKLSLKATFPQFKALESRYRSLILGMMASRKKETTQPNVPEIAKKSTFLSFKGGLYTLVAALEKALVQTEIMQGRKVQGIFDRKKNGDPTLSENKSMTDARGTDSEGRYLIELDNQEILDADAVILTIPPAKAADLLPDDQLGSELCAVQYVSVANVIFAFDEKELTFDFDGTGFLVPKSEGRRITACTWTSSKWTHTAPEGKVLIRCYVGRAGDEDITFLPEQELVSLVRRELKELMNIDTEPLFYEINRWPKAMPQYPVGHVENVQKVREQLAERCPGIYVTGAGYGGVGLPDCVHNGKEAAKQAIDTLF